MLPPTIDWWPRTILVCAKGMHLVTVVRKLVVVWHSGNGIGHNKVTLRRAQCVSSHAGQLGLVPHSRMGNEYWPKCSDVLWLGSKGRYGSFHLWINMWVTGKNV